MAEPWAEVYRLLAELNAFLALWQAEAYMHGYESYSSYVAMYASAARERYHALDREATPFEERRRLKCAFDLLARVLARCGIEVTEAGWSCEGTVAAPPPGDPDVMLFSSVAGLAIRLTPPPESDSDRRMRYAFERYYMAGVDGKTVAAEINAMGWKPVTGESGVRFLATTFAKLHGFDPLPPKKTGPKPGE